MSADFTVEPARTRWVPRDYQRTGVKFLIEHACAGLFLDPSMGKTSVTLAAFMLLLRERVAARMLVIAPLRVAQIVWPAEVSKWEDFKHLKMHLLHGKGRTDEAIVQARKKGVQIFVINPDNLRWLFSNGRFAAIDADTLVVDELTKFKRTKTQRFKSLKPFLPRFKRRWGLTGSPAANGLLDLFGQCYVLDLGRTLGPFITHYRATYFMPTGYGGYTWVLKKGADQQIYERLTPLVLRLDADDHLDLPQVVINTVHIDLPEEARRIYDGLENELLANLGNEVVTAANVGAALSKCRQVASGGIYLDSAEGAWRKVHEEKTEAVVQLLDELQGSPALVAYDFMHDRERLADTLGNVPYLGGGVKHARFKEIEDAWNKGDLPVLLVHPQSAAHGLNLQHSGHHLIWHTLTYDYELYEQQIYRLRRPGQKHKRIFVHHIVARNTVDEAVSRALERKAKGQRALLDALRDYARK